MSNMIKAGVIGWPISHSRSPLIHNFWLKENGIEGAYEKIAVAPDELEDFILRLGEAGYAGVNVTVPHKEHVFKLASYITEDAKVIGAVNTLWFESGQLMAGNTDAQGFINHLKATCLKASNQWQPSGPAVVLGAGGAARAIVYALLSEGIDEIRLVNRTYQRAESLTQYFSHLPGRVSAFHWRDLNKALGGCALLVNSTSLGMIKADSIDLARDDHNTPSWLDDLDLTQPENEAIVYDIVYVPLETGLLKKAAQCGLQTVDGLGMLLHQAAPAFEKWFGATPKVTDRLRQLIIDDLEAS